MPENLELYLIDTEIDREINLKTSRKYTFDAVTQSPNEPKSKVSLNQGNQTVSDDRFELLVISSVAENDNEKPQQQKVVLSPNYPNPFRNQTTMDLQLNEDMHVKVTVWNIVGQKVATLVDKPMAEGEYPMTWQNTSSLPSGIYICKVEAG